MKTNLEVFLILTATFLILSLHSKEANAEEDEDSGKKNDGGKSDPPKTVLGGTLEEDRKTAEELAAKISAIHQSDPRDAMQLAQRVLTKAFDHFNNGMKTIKLTTILRAVYLNPGKELLFVLRLFEFMDTNVNYEISDEEFTNLFTSPTAYPHRLIDLMFNIQDFDGDGFINKYEWLQTEMLDLGVNYNLHDLWRSVNQGISEMDVSDDGIVDEPEYVNFVIYQVNKAIVQQRNDAKMYSDAASPTD